MKTLILSMYDSCFCCDAKEFETKKRIKFAESEWMKLYYWRDNIDSIKELRKTYDRIIICIDGGIDIL